MAFTISTGNGGEGFSAAPDEDLLTAAARAGLARDWRCANGTCGSCAVRLADGRGVARDGTSLDGASPVQLCKTRAASDLELRHSGVTRVEQLAPQVVELELVGRRSLSSQVLRLDLEVVGNDTLRWLPGQYLEFLWRGDQRRPFSIANADRGDNRLELHARHASDGDFSRWVREGFTLGKRIHAEGPFGSFVPREASERPLLLVAGGTGLAPIKAMIEHFARLGTRRPMSLYWGVRQVEDLYLDSLVEDWDGPAPRVDFVPVVSHALGPLPDSMRAGLVVDAAQADHPDLSGFDVYVCGPPGMVDNARAAFAAAGVPVEQLFTDNYRHAPQRLAAVLAQRAGLRGVR